MVVSAEHLCFKIVAYFVYQVNFEERFSADEVPHNAFFLHIILMVEDIVNCQFSYLPGHTLFRVFPYEVAIFAGKLAVFGNDESDRLCHS